jgi:hypothetical protein
VLRWAKDGDLVGGVAEGNEQPAGYTFFNSDTKVEHPAVDPDGGFRYIQNHTRTGGILGIEFANMVSDLTNNDLDKNGLPDYLTADVTRILPAVNGALKLDVGNKGVGHFDALGNPAGATAEQHIELKNRKANDPDGLLWVKSSDADILIVDEDSGNDYGERKYALVINEDTLAIEPDGTGYFIAQAGGNKNPRAIAGVSTYGGTFESKSGSEFSGSWDVTALVATKADGSFYTQEELAGNGVQIVEQNRPLSEHVFIGAVQQGGESGGALKAVKADYGGQIVMFSLALPGIEPRAIESQGNTKLIRRDDGIAFVESTAGMRQEITVPWGVSATVSDNNEWQMLAADNITGFNQVLWRNNTSSFLHVWNLDANWNLQSTSGADGFNTPKAWELETNFQVDGNRDGIIGAPYTTLEPKAAPSCSGAAMALPSWRPALAPRKRSRFPGVSARPSATATSGRCWALKRSATPIRSSGATTTPASSTSGTSMPTGTCKPPAAPMGSTHPQPGSWKQASRWMATAMASSERPSDPSSRSGRYQHPCL